MFDPSHSFQSHIYRNAAAFHANELGQSHRCCERPVARCEKSFEHVCLGSIHVVHSLPDLASTSHVIIMFLSISCKAKSSVP